MQIQLRDPIESKIQETVLQKKIRKRNKKLYDQKIRALCSGYSNEIQYLWNSDPDRQGKEVYDSGEIHDLNQQYEKEAVRRDLRKNALIRVRTGKQVYWSDFEGRWIDC
jgi:hypothetical protein